MTGPAPDHQIRLRGPWQLSLVRNSATGGEPEFEPLGRFRAPAGLRDRLPADFRGRARLERSFHRPTGLRPESRILLRIETNLAGQWTLNRMPLGDAPAGIVTFPITHVLQTRNRLSLDVVIDEDALTRQPICDVLLEIFA